MLVFGLAVLGEAGYQVFYAVMPRVETMGIIGGLALVANLGCFFLTLPTRRQQLEHEIDLAVLAQ